MKRINPIGSLFGFGLTILLFVGLGFSLWYNRGLAFSPGSVTSKTNGMILKGFVSHADFEKQCSYCHEPLTKSLAEKCLFCHEDISLQMENEEGVHSKMPGLNRCDSCHPEHKGRDFDPTLASLELFDHSYTHFSLNWHQENYDATPMECNACHVDEDYSTVKDQVCLDCHANHEASFVDRHARDFGPNCKDCHDGVDRMRDFDHASTGYALIGQHLQVSCTGCHKSGEIGKTPQNCVDCHAEPNVHKSVFVQSCDTCHTPAAWKPALLNDQPFEHLANTGFSLRLHLVDYLNQTLTCLACHTPELQSYEQRWCITCHTLHDQAFMVEHQQQFGAECLTCHDGVDRMSNFEHANFFVLDGRHASLACADCHINQVYRGTADQCSGCHTEPDIHASVFGLECADCHTTEAWSPAMLLQHKFPLNHGMADPTQQSQCSVCHGANYIEYTCYNCHEHQVDEITKKHLEEGISTQELPECAKCHADGLVHEGDDDR